MPSGKPRRGVSSPTSKCCSDFYCHTAAPRRSCTVRGSRDLTARLHHHQGRPQCGQWVNVKQEARGPGPRRLSTWLGARTAAEMLPSFTEPCAGGVSSQLLPVLKRGDHLHKLLPGCSPACWQNRVGVAILYVTAQRDVEVVWGEVPGQNQKSL